MHLRGSLAVLAIASLSLIPSLASAGFVEKWHLTSGTNFRVLSDIGALNDDGTYVLVTGEFSGAGEKIGIRSGTTGALLAQSVAVYQDADLQFANLDADGNVDIIFSDALTGKLNCLDYTTGSGTVTVRWSITPSGQPSTLFFADFDGNGHLYFVLSDVNSDPNFYIYDRNGVLATTITSPGPVLSGGWQLFHKLQDYDADGRQELLLTYHNAAGGSSDQLFLYENNSPPAAVAGLDGQPHSIELSSSFPNPTSSASRIQYTMANSGPASLRLFDVTGREVRTLLDGNVIAGRHEAVWDGRDASGHALPAGAYFYELRAGGERLARRVIRIQ